jgi:hypothetical protein
MTATPPVPPPATPPVQAQSGGGKKKKKRKFKLSASWASVIVAFIAIPGGWLGGYLTASGGSTSSSAPASVSIDAPQNNEVPVQASFSGSVNNLQAGESVWLFVRRVENKQAQPTTYPGDGPCTVDLIKNTWHCDIRVGSSGNKYQVCPAVLDFSDADEAVTRLQAAAVNSVLPKTAKPHMAWFPAPPSYIIPQICTTVTAT